MVWEVPLKVALLSQAYEECAYCQRTIRFIDHQDIKLVPIVTCRNYVPSSWLERSGCFNFINVVSNISDMFDRKPSFRLSTTEKKE